VAGKHLNEDNVSNWRLGGYQDHQNAHLVNDRARTQTEAAADVLRDTGQLGPAKLQQVCQEIALLQYLRTLMDHGDQLAQDSLKKNPAKMITLMNACCNNMATQALPSKSPNGETRPYWRPLLSWCPQH